jgi:hypothetical protein
MLTTEGEIVLHLKPHYAPFRRGGKIIWRDTSRGRHPNKSTEAHMKWYWYKRIRPVSS